MERAIADEPESDIHAPVTQNQSHTAPDSNPVIDPAFSLPFDGCIDPSLLFNSFMDPIWDVEGDIDINIDMVTPGFYTPQQHTLSLRLAQLSSELQSLAAENPHLGVCNGDSFDELFTPARVQQAALALSRKRHFQFPLIHWPTFDLEKACLPLLVAITLTGTAYSSRSDSHQDNEVIKVHNYYSIAAAYIFKSLERHMEARPLTTPTSASTTSSMDDAESAVEHLQAGLLVFVLTICLNDAGMRRTGLSKRLPTLVAGIRSLELVGARHETGEDWSCFARVEARIRVVAWTFFMDCLTTVFCNKPPLMVYAETCGHLPCIQATWDADSAEEFAAARKMEEETGLGFLRLDRLAADLLRDDWPGSNQLPYEGLNFHHLNAIICGKTSINGQCTYTQVLPIF